MERQEEQMGKCESESNSPTLLDAENVHQAHLENGTLAEQPRKVLLCGYLAPI